MATITKRRMPTAIVYDEFHKFHNTGPKHPEKPLRCEALIRALRTADFAEELMELRPREVNAAHLALCHVDEYIALVQRECAAGGTCLSTGDTNICRNSFEAALRAAGGVLAAVDAVVRREAQNAFCVVRPGGHHAETARGMGFCLFNNVAIGARYAQQAYQMGKVLIVDWDLHHGNGTQEIFYEDDSVLFLDIHQWDWYPYTGFAEECGKGRGLGYTINCPLQARAGGKEVRQVFQEKLVPAVDRFRPEIVFISAGFDARKGDPCGHLQLVDQDFADLTEMLRQIADEHAQGRLISVLEGGYKISGVVAGGTAHVQALLK